MSPIRHRPPPRSNLAGLRLVSSSRLAVAEVQPMPDPGPPPAPPTRLVMILRPIERVTNFLLPPLMARLPGTERFVGRIWLRNERETGVAWGLKMVAPGGVRVVPVPGLWALQPAEGGRGPSAVLELGGGRRAPVLGVMDIAERPPTRLRLRWLDAHLPELELEFSED